MQKKSLFCIVCGFERGGTTLVAELIRQHPEVDGRFECGFLLVDSPTEFPKLKRYARNLKIAWGLSTDDLEYIVQASSYQEAYRRLVERSDLKRKDVSIYDKTPRYMRTLPEVLQKVDVPCVCVVRDPRALYWSKQRHWDETNLQLGKYEKLYSFLSGITRPRFISQWTELIFQKRLQRLWLQDFCDYYSEYAQGWEAANEIFSDRILLVRHDELCINPEVETRKIYDFLGLEFRPEYLLMPERPDQYVDRGGILPEVVYEYKSGLSKKNQKYLLKHTKAYSDWHWHG